jgi:hypothetical protein
MAGSEIPRVSPGAKTVVRGTQSFVGVMAQVWKRPALTGFEVLWRWSFGIVLIALFAWSYGPRILQSTQSLNLGQVGTALISTQLWLRDHGRARLYGISFHGAELTVVICLVWSAVSAAGRDRILQKLEPSFRHNLPSLIVLSLLRVVTLSAVVLFWIWAVSNVAETMVFEPFYARQEPAYVQFAAILIVGTLALFVCWMALSYIFHLAQVISMAKHVGPFRSLREAIRRGPLNGKLIEINLVLGIVKIALLVLAMVFSACPLPFSTVETQEFLTWWWIGVGVWYLLASDYFHVVRSAAYVAMWLIYSDAPQSAVSRTVEIAS